jgi:hypothetical protein
MAGEVRSLVHRRVRNAIREYLSPLMGGVPIPDEDDALSGTGWPLGMEIRRQDLEAVAVRVAGVRYVTTIQLGTQRADGSLQDVNVQPLLGLELPWLTGIAVGDNAEPLDIFSDSKIPTTGDLIPVPVIPKKC